MWELILEVLERETVKDLFAVLRLRRTRLSRREWHPDDNEKLYLWRYHEHDQKQECGKKLLNWKKIVWKKSSWCAKQNRECPITLPKPDDTESLNVLGAPCVLFSKNLVGQRTVFLCIYDS